MFVSALLLQLLEGVRHHDSDAGFLAGIFENGTPPRSHFFFLTPGALPVCKPSLLLPAKRAHGAAGSDDPDRMVASVRDHSSLAACATPLGQLKCAASPCLSLILCEAIDLFYNGGSRLSPAERMRRAAAALVTVMVMACCADAGR